MGTKSVLVLGYVIDQLNEEKKSIVWEREKEEAFIMLLKNILVFILMIILYFDWTGCLIKIENNHENKNKDIWFKTW